MPKDKTRSVDEIRVDLARNRAQVADAVSDFVDEVHPKNVARRGMEDAKHFVTGEFENVKAQVKDEGGWRMDRIKVIGGALLGVVVFVVTINVIANKRTRSIDARVRRELESRL